MLAVINNYPKHDEPRFKDLVKAINSVSENIPTSQRYSKSEIAPVHFSELNPDSIRNARAIISSGSTYNLPTEIHLFKAQIDFIRKTNRPFLGICFGHELLGLAYGGKVRKISILKSDFEQIYLLQNDPLLIPYRKDDNIVIAESHHKIVKPAPEGFEILGETAEHHIEIMKHPTKFAYGIQGHPERSTKDHPQGFTILQNFLSMT